MNEFEHWLNRHGTLGLDPKATSANGIVFLVEMYVWQYIFDEFDRTSAPWNDLFNFRNSVYKHQISEGVYAQHPDDKKDPSSHDNTTAIVSLSFLEDCTFHKTVKIWGHYWHPRDVIFYSYLRGEWYDSWCYIFLPLMTFFFWQSSYKKYTYRPDIFDRIKTFFKTGKWEKPNEILHTGGKILTWIRFECTIEKKWWMRVTKNLCYKELERHFGTYYIKEMQDYYFKNKDHPVRVLASRYL